MERLLCQNPLLKNLQQNHIAWSLGYRSESAFSNAFSRATGVSPGRFRKEAMQTYMERRRRKVDRRAVEAE